MEENLENGPQISEYKGRPVITLNPGERYPFTFGISKAKLLLENLDHIRKFVEEYDKK